MKTKLHMARPEDLQKLLAMVAAFHAEFGIVQDDDTRLAAVLPLLEGSPLGVVYILGPRNAPVGYVSISFGWSIALGGIDGCIDEFWIRPAVRGKGMGGEALSALIRALSDAGVRALHLETDRQSPVGRLYERLGFERREKSCLMSADLTRP
ncbi:GNAT family N-acetyltransferase [Aliiruegeria lutimaris]|uniref:Protein N-acetyltransferase, RimJ/RimL family n=1 Tax=Aliiruegeria lutimaris TaxID=571298 RepID=A0A1G8PQE9_9RHOB|nr:GNAT family N-acetyltransferase [Aliiruegeria lutimaris]SDI94642.1 Protein N-acetyltransferase, RimJ/RimL family [Aliiruegeria lutimaris]